MKKISVIILLLSFLLGCNNSNAKYAEYGDELKIEKEYYQDGKLIIEKIYNKENRKLIAEIPRQNDKIDGIAKKNYSNGKVRILIPYKNGIRDGLAEIYDTDGKLEISIPYKNGKKEGILKEYRENGDVGDQMAFKNDKKEGETILKSHPNRIYYGSKTSPLILKSRGPSYLKILFHDNIVMSGVCNNHRKLNNAEIINLNNGYSIECGDYLFQIENYDLLYESLIDIKKWRFKKDIL